ncbi:hypothetical protein [Halogranum amylolyticum]|uniref:hypothetical protein n=1 Tax=Halogranum amylolyticum TaxID=660520 RepID=UPI00147EE984|nr:hypothetical protein [Halogranum amylolyticum]
MKIVPELDLDGFSDELKTTATLIREFTSQAPPAVRLTLTNISSTQHEVFTGFTPPFSQYVLHQSSGAEENMCIVVPSSYPRADDVVVPTAMEEGCWTAEDIPSILETGMIKELDSGESISEVYTVLNHSSNDSCYPVGKYTSLDQIAIDDQENESEISFAITVVEG